MGLKRFKGTKAAIAAPAAIGAYTGIQAAQLLLFLGGESGVGCPCAPIGRGRPAKSGTPYFIAQRARRRHRGAQSLVAGPRQSVTLKEHEPVVLPHWILFPIGPATTALMFN